MQSDKANKPSAVFQELQEHLRYGWVAEEQGRAKPALGSLGSLGLGRLSRRQMERSQPGPVSKRKNRQGKPLFPEASDCFSPVVLLRGESEGREQEKAVRCCGTSDSVS